MENNIKQELVVNTNFNRKNSQFELEKSSKYIGLGVHLNTDIKKVKS